LAGTENRIATARRDYNDSVKTYNSKIKTFPALIVAGMMGKEEKSYFEVSDPSKEEVPTVDFSK
jgi:LemA protein